MQDVPVCGECGYQLTGLSEDPAGAVRCPECGVSCELATAPRLRPWPRPVAIGWRLCGPHLANVGAFLLVVVLVGAFGAENVPRLPGIIVVLTLIGCLPLTGLVHPYLGAVLLAEQHAVRARRTAAFLRVFGGAVAVNALVFAAGTVAAAMLDAW